MRSGVPAAGPAADCRLCLSGTRPPTSAMEGDVLLAARPIVRSAGPSGARSPSPPGGVHPPQLPVERRADRAAVALRCDLDHAALSEPVRARTRSRCKRLSSCGLAGSQPHPRGEPVAATSRRSPLIGNGRRPRSSWRKGTGESVVPPSEGQRNAHGLREGNSADKYWRSRGNPPTGIRRREARRSASLRCHFHAE